MAIMTTSSLSNEYQTYYTNKLLAHAVQLTVLDQFADQVPFPKNSGNKAIRFFKKSVADSTQVQDLTAGGEGVAPSARRALTLTPIDVTLNQYGEVTSVTDIVSWTDKLRILKESIGTMQEDCALHTDGIIRNEIVATNISDAVSRTKAYAQGAANWAALAAATQATGALVATDVLNQLTALKILRAPKIKGEYVWVCPPQISRDLMNDAKWLNLSAYSKPDMTLKGEAGMFFGCKVVEHTNPFIEDGADAASEGTYDGTGTSADSIFVSFFLGKGSYGCPVMAGQSPFSPRVYIVDTADKSDPLNQQTLAGWKAYYAAKLYQSNWLIAFRAKSGYGL
jgi:N4-gp56 family major capsid protein